MGYPTCQAEEAELQKQMCALEADVKAQQEQLKQLQADLNLHAALKLSAQQVEQVRMCDLYFHDRPPAYLSRPHPFAHSSTCIADILQTEGQLEEYGRVSHKMFHLQGCHVRRVVKHFSMCRMQTHGQPKEVLHWRHSSMLKLTSITLAAACSI